MIKDSNKKLIQRVMLISILGFVIISLATGLSLIKIGYEFRDAHNEEMEQFLHENPNADIEQQRVFAYNSPNLWRSLMVLSQAMIALLISVIATMVIPDHHVYRWSEILREKIYDLIYKFRTILDARRNRVDR